MMDAIFTPHGNFLLDFAAALLGIGLVAAFLAAFAFGILTLFYIFRAWTIPALKATVTWLDDPLKAKETH